MNTDSSVTPIAGNGAMENVNDNSFNSLLQWGRTKLIHQQAEMINLSKLLNIVQMQTAFIFSKY